VGRSGLNSLVLWDGKYWQACNSHQFLCHNCSLFDFQIATSIRPIQTLFFFLHRQKCSLPKANKRFLNSVIASNVASNKRMKLTNDTRSKSARSDRSKSARSGGSKSVRSGGSKPARSDRSKLARSDGSKPARSDRSKLATVARSDGKECRK